MLALEIEFLTGVCRAALSPADDMPDWPPQPDRIFSALVAAWGATGENATERKALEWLEQLPAPVLHASSHEVRSAPDVFVPPNDLKSSKSATTYLKVLPARRRRQPRRFPVARPHDPIMHVVWDAAPVPEVLAQLNKIAKSVTYVGHSASLVRCQFSLSAPVSRNAPTRARRRIYAGRLAELVAAHAEKPVRPTIPSAASNAEPVSSAKPNADAALVLETLSDVPDIRASALVCGHLRKALMSGYRREFGDSRLPEIVSGHAADGSPTKGAHLAIQPMAFVGHPQADARVFGFAIIPPKTSDILATSEFRRAFTQIAKYDAARERRVLTLKGGPLRAPIELSPSGDTTRRSLSFEPYSRAVEVWASVTPVVLERHLKGKGDEEVLELVATACEHAGLPRPRPTRIRVGKHSAIMGAPPARPSSGSPKWSGWKVPKPFATRTLVHVLIDFEHAVKGPVLLGAGRFTGLGLCRAVGTNR